LLPPYSLPLRIQNDLAELLAILEQLMGSRAFRQGHGAVDDGAQLALAEKQVLQVEHDWIGAYLNHDIAALENALADDWTYSPSNGSFKTRAQFVEEFRVDTMKYESITQNNAKVRVYGITAVVTGDEVIKGSDGGKELSSHIRFTDFLVKRDDRWQAVASHETNILEPSDAPATP
jgi:ketosteroid isomerase-like protein